MGKVLARSARALGREMNFFGDKDRDLVLQTKGRIKINFGDKFTELFNGSEFTVGNKAIKATNGKPGPGMPNGLYFDEETGTLYLKWGDNVYEIFTGAESEDGFISYKVEQNLTKEERIQALKNLGLWFDSEEDAINSGFNGIVWIDGKGPCVIINGEIIPLLPEDDSEGGKDEGYVFDGTVTINVGDNEIAIEIPGLNKYIHLGIEGNETYIYQGDEGLVINSDKSIHIQVDDRDQIIINDGSVDFDAIINALKGIITDEIYSSNFEKGDPSTGGGKGWGIWIDKNTGESYLQVDHIITKTLTEPVYLYYHEALQLANLGQVEIGKLYVVIDFQNEWEKTPFDDLLGVEWAQNQFYAEYSVDPSQYEDEDATDPIYGLDRNVRPILLKGKNAYEYEDIITYWFNIDNKDIVDIRYDIWKKNYPEDLKEEEGYPDDFNYDSLKNKGRIYYMKDTWNNEAPLDFKHYWEDDGNGGKKYIFTSPTGTDLSFENSEDNIVCVNNIIYDIGTRISEELHPIIITGKKINNNEFRGLFNECTLGDPESIIENNDFRGDNDKVNFTGTIQNNDFRSNLTDVLFEKQVIGNVFNRDVTNTKFHGEVNNNTFNVKFTNCDFQDVISNQVMGEMSDCTFQDSLHDNQLTFSTFNNCTAASEVYSNVMNVQTVNNCKWNDSFFSNQITANTWENNTFNGSLRFNVFQADVINLQSLGGMMNNNQFMGKINNVTFNNNGNPTYGINNNIINGSFYDSTINVDFSHNIITGITEFLTVNPGAIGYLEDYCKFNHNTITSDSIHTVTINADFQFNKIATGTFGNVTIDGIYYSNDMNYVNMRNLNHYSDFTYNEGKGETFIGGFREMKNCKFQSIENCTFRDSLIEYAYFRYDFKGINFDSNTAIQDLERLYNDDHQVDVFYHNNEKIVVACQVCNSSMKGEIKMWYPEAGSIPNGWHICDGTEGTPNLIGRFIKADTECKESTDEDSMDYPFEINSENAPVGAHTHTSSTSSEDITSTGTGTAVFRIPGHTHELKFVNTTKAKRVETGDGDGAQSYHFAGLGSIYKTDEQWDAVTGSGGIVASSQWDGNGLISEALEQEITADFDVTVNGSTGGSSSESGEPSGGTDKTLQIKWPRYYSLIFIMKL